MKSSRTIPIAIIMGGVIVAAAVYFSLRHEPSTSSGRDNPALVRPVGAADHIFGNPAAPVTIIEYADFYCEYCKGFDDVLHQIVATEGAGGSVAWVFREFPLTEIHPDAAKAASAAECAAAAGGNDAFWRFKSILFAHQPADAAQFGNYAQGADIPSDAFASCYASASTTVAARIAADRQNALDMGAVGTPYSVIVAPGKAPVVIDGADDYDQMKMLVDQALAQ